MALEFHGIQPVNFGGKDCTPEINTETKLRLNQIERYDNETDETLASAFPKDEAYVKKFLHNQMTAFEKQKLHAYLTGGMDLVDKVEKEIEQRFHESFNKAIGGDDGE